MRTLILLCLLGVAFAQFEAGFVKILEDKRYQDGGAFGNFRDQEDGIQYFEETDAQGVRRGYWEYPSQDGTILRTEFEAGPGIGFRVTKSNHHAATPVAKPRPQFQPIPVPQPQPTPAPIPVAPIPVARPHNPVPVHNPIPAFQAPIPTPTPLPDFQNLFDYPGNLEFSRSQHGHRFKFTAA